MATLYSRVKKKPKLKNEEESTMATQAQNFKANYSDTNDLMTALDNADVESDQDWENETTVWTFEDGSKIIVSGSGVEVK